METPFPPIEIEAEFWGALQAAEKAAGRPLDVRKREDHYEIYTWASARGYNALCLWMHDHSDTDPVLKDLELQVRLASIQVDNLRLAILEKSRLKPIGLKENKRSLVTRMRARSLAEREAVYAHALTMGPTMMERKGRKVWQ